MAKRSGFKEEIVDYSELEPSQLFDLYRVDLNFLREKERKGGKVTRSDLNELERMAKIFENWSLPRRVSFYQSLTDPEQRTLYRRNFLELILEEPSS